MDHPKHLARISPDWIGNTALIDPISCPSSGLVNAEPGNRCEGTGTANTVATPFVIGGMEHVLIVEMPGRCTRPGRFNPGSAARCGEAGCRTDLDGFRLISLSPARSADGAWRPVDSVGVVEVTVRPYDRRDAAGVAGVGG